MDNYEFIRVIKEVVRDAAVTGTISILEKPPGRHPPEQLKICAAWYRTLDREQRSVLSEIITDAVDSAVFGLLCVIDGVRAVEDGEDKGKFELRHIKGNIVNIIAPANEMLHETYNGTAG